MDLSSELESLGLTSAEADILLALHEHGASSAGELAKKTQVNRTTSYDALERLIEKGFVTYTVQANRRTYRVLDSEFFTKYFKEQYNKAITIAQQFDAIKQHEDELFEVFEGKKGINAILHDILEYDEYCAYGSSGRFMETMRADFVHFQKKKKQRNIKSRVLQTEISDELHAVAHAQFRILPDLHASPVTTILYGAYVVIIIWSQTPHALRIRSNFVKQQFQHQFDMLWQTSKRA